MTTLTATPLASFARSAWLQRLWAGHRPLVLTGLASLGLLAASTVLALVDPRLITGAPAWVKPMKFAISTAAYALTLAWMLSHVKGHPRLVGLIGWVTALGFIIELALIVLQVVRGVRSHFNMSTAFDATVFSVMGSTIVVVWLMNLLAAILVLRQPFTDRAFAWSLRLGLLVSSVGMLVAFFMTSMPSPAQRAEIEAGRAPQTFGAHSVGVEDGGRGLPFVGWSTEGGDLRIPHFVGLHGLQVIPLIGLAINRLFAALNERRRTALVWAGGLGYLGLTMLLTWQALRGQPLIAPDGLTLSALAALVGVVALAGALVVAVARREQG